MNEKILKISIILLFILFLANTTITLGQQDFQAIMNASIQQPICIQLSNNYSAGVFFTNTTTIGIQYPITNMKVLNNATANYVGASFGTEYYVQACPGNTINVKVAHCACDDLICQSGDCAVGTDKLYVANTSQGGVGWANGTTATFSTHIPPGNSYYFQGIDQYQIIAGDLAPSSSIYMRYWMDPRPDSAPSGKYQTTFQIRAVEISSSIGTCSC
ncbi:MAG: hypothetical protein KQA41_04270 [Candidatus Aenigmarchaeota archaeon]|nr:hypothetical protein [Candidatus Aenigmarchaeota archaeon]